MRALTNVHKGVDRRVAALPLPVLVPLVSDGSPGAVGLVLDFFHLLFRFL